MLRWYQEEAVQSIFRYFEIEKGNPLVVMPGGTGKSHVIAGFTQRVFGIWHTQRFLILTHVKELIKQDVEKLVEAWPLAPIGIYSAGLGEKTMHAPITFGGVASVVKVVEQFGHIDIIIVDEAHLIAPGEDTMYQEIIAKLKAINPFLKVIGLTATPFRLGQGLLVEGKIFTHVCYDISGVEPFNRMVAEGFLVPPIPRRTKLTLNVQNVGISNTGDYKAGELQKAVNRDEITHAALQEAMELGSDRRSWLVFASGIEHSDRIAQMLGMFGVSAASVHSKTPGAERDEKIKLFKQGYFRAMVGNNVFTTGFDHPPIDMLLILRATLSTVLWVQMLSRGTRPSNGKSNCLVLDYAANTRRLGPINDPIIPRVKGQGGGVPPIKTCEHCGTYNHISVRFCIGCGVEFNFAVKIIETASADELVKRDLPIIEMFSVTRVVINRHEKLGSFPTMEVIYYCNGMIHRFHEFICLEHPGFAGKKARDWWRLRHWTEPPATTDEALRYISELRAPKRIRVHVNKKYPDILGYEWV